MTTRELLVQSLKAIMETDEDDTFSYFQLAGESA